MALLVPDVGEVELLAKLLYGRGKAITNATNATPIVITSNGHGLANGQAVTITDVGGNTAANGTFLASNVATNTFELRPTTTGTAGAGVAGNGAYTSGGFWSLAGVEDGTLKLRTDGVTPAEGDTAGTYTEATFTGYVTKTLNGKLSSSAGWAVPTTSTGTTSSTYTPTLSWSPTSSQTVTGYFVVGAGSGTLWWAENFASSKALSSGDTLNLTGKLELA
jgi:hypothetical protein